MLPGPYDKKTPEFFSLHYNGSDLTDAMRLGLPPKSITSLQISGRGNDGITYCVSLSGANNIFGSFVAVGSPLQDETHFFRRLVGQMEKNYGAKAQPFVYALNEHRQTAWIPTREPAVFVDLAMLEELLKFELLMDGLVFDLYFDGLENKPRTNVSGKVEISGYTLEPHDDLFERQGGKIVRQPYYTRTYLDEKGQPEE